MEVALLDLCVWGQLSRLVAFCCVSFPATAGILQEQAPAVVEAYSPWFEGFAVEAEDRWALVTARRRTGGGVTSELAAERQQPPAG